MSHLDCQWIGNRGKVDSLVPVYQLARVALKGVLLLNRQVQIEQIVCGLHQFLKRHQVRNVLLIACLGGCITALRGGQTMPHDENSTGNEKCCQRDKLGGGDKAEAVAVEPCKVEQEADSRVRHQVNQYQVAAAEPILESPFNP